MQIRSYKIAAAIFLGAILTFAGIQKSAAQAILPGFSASSLPRNDDGSSASVAMGFSINYFGTTRTNLFVNNNGNVTFSGTAGLSSFTPNDLTRTSSEILAPFWADVDTRNSASATVTYGTGTVNGHNAFGVNWAGVGYYASHADKLNNFQLVIVDRSDTGVGNWDFEFNYANVLWETGDASGGVNGLGGSSARAGFSLATGTSGGCLELPGSAFNGYLLDSGPAETSLIHNSLFSSQAGRYLFSVRGGSVAIPPPAIWLGSTDSQWSTAGNWFVDPTSGSGITVPSSYTDVVLSGSGAINESTILDRNFLIKSLTVSSSNAVTIGGTSTLTILGTVGTTGIAVNSGAGLFTMNCNVTLGGDSQTITVSNTAGMVINGNVGGVIGLRKEGSGTLVLGGSNTYTGSTYVNAGTLVIGNGAGGSIQASSVVNVGSSAELLFNMPENARFGSAILNSGTVTLPGTRTLTLSGSLQNLGTVNVSGDHPVTLSGNLRNLGAVNVFGSNAVTFSGNIQNSSTMTLSGTQTVTLSGALSGSGSLVQNSVGTTVLAGVSNYSGAINVMQGVLQVGNGASGSLHGAGLVTVNPAGTLALNMPNNSAMALGIVNNGLIASVSSQTSTLSSAISGTGAFLQSGAGVTILSGANTSTGPITVSGGTLQVGDGTVGSTIETASSVTVNSGGSLAFNLANGSISNQPILNNGVVLGGEANTNVLSGVISGAGAFYQAGSGVTVLVGSNTYTGATVVARGVLRIGNGSLGTISASSALSTQAGGTLVLSSTDTSLLSRSIANDGSVVLDEPFAAPYTFSGSITGAGALIKSGANTLILGGTNSYAGATVVAGGLLQVASASALPSGSALMVVSGGGIDIRGLSLSLGSLSGDSSVITGASTVTTVGTDNSNTIFSGVISGLGDVNKVGAGTWNLTGANTYTGATRILGGGVLVNGSLQGDVFVMNGVLGGSGIIRGNVTNQSLVSPGNSPGKLTIAGNYTQLPGGALLIQMPSPTSYDQLVIGGTANLDGALVVDTQGNFRLRGVNYTILTASGGVTGAFSDTSSLYPFRLKLIYGPNSIILTSIYRYFGDVPGMTANQRAVAGGIDKSLDQPSIYGNARLLQTFDDINSLATQDIPAALERIVPTDYVLLPDATFASAQVQASNLEWRMQQIRTGLADYTAAVNAPSTFYTSNAVSSDAGLRFINAEGRELNPPPMDRCLSFFLNGSAEYVEDKTAAILGDGKFNTGGISTGADYRFSDNLAAGLTAGYANTTTNGRGDGKLGIESGDLSAYATAFKNGYFANGILGGGASNYNLKRESLGSGLARGDTSGMNFHALLGGGYTYYSGGFSAGPIASMRYCVVNIDGFAERGSSAPLDVASQSKSSFKTTAGFQVAYEIPVGSLVIRPQAKAQWLHEYANDNRDITASFEGAGGSSFTVNGPSLGADHLLFDVGAAVQITPMVSAYGSFLSDTGATNYSSRAFFGGVQLSF